jgi:hypothetical protein
MADLGGPGATAPGWFLYVSTVCLLPSVDVACYIPRVDERSGNWTKPGQTGVREAEHLQDRRAINVPLPAVGSDTSRILTDNCLPRSALPQRTDTSLCKQGVTWAGTARKYSNVLCQPPARTAASTPIWLGQRAYAQQCR